MDSPENNTFTPESLKKQFRLSEYLAEKIISSIAFMSIAMIVLIFIFVFRESLPLFGPGEDAKAPVGAVATGSAGLKPEAYGSETANAAELKPESYGDPVDATPSEELKPETYGDVVSDSAASLQPETYGDVTADHSAEAPATETAEAPHSKPWSTFVTNDWVPVSDNPRYGLIALLIGTLKVTLISILIAGPIAILAALYTSTFASKRGREIIKPVIELLAAFPSVVIGFFALMVLATFFQDVFGYGTRLNAFVGGVAMALAAIPIIYTIAEDALTAVPKTYSEASLALGASKWQTAFFVTLPAAVPGIFAALLLGVGRVFGETMIALMATGNAALATLSPFDSVRTFAATIGSEMAETVFGDTHYSVLFFIGSMLFIFSFALNAIAEFYIKGRLIKKIQGK
jgi:phosphate transport system permease protein